MADQGLMNYIKNAKVSGKSIEEIRATLVAGKNIPEADIDAALYAAEQPEVVIAETPFVSGDKNVSIKLIASLSLFLLMIGTGVYFYVKHKKLEVRLEIAVEYACAALRAIKENPQLFSQSNPNNVTIGEYSETMNTLQTNILKNMKAVEEKYHLTEAELKKEIVEIGRLMSTDKTFKNQVDEKAVFYFKQKKCV